MELPICPTCIQPMIFCMAIPYKEYVCIPCGTSEEFFCDKLESSKEDHDRKKQLWSDDIHALAIRNGARCILKYDNKSCAVCDNLDSYEYRYYLKGNLSISQKKDQNENL